MKKQTYETPKLEEAGSFEEITLAIQGGDVVDQQFLTEAILGGNVPDSGAFS